MKTKIIDTFLAVKAQNPLVHNITNLVVMNTSANALLAIGASPVMAHAKEELEEMLSIASSLVINMGTIDKRSFKAMRKASKIADARALPWVLDPVGAGATSYRTDSALALISQHSPSLIRANASEILALTDSKAKTKGVDSTISSDSALTSAKALARIHDCTVVISGVTDFVVSAEQQTAIHNGAKIMAQVTGMGCISTAITGACLAVAQDSHTAGVTAMAIMGVAGEIAEKNALGSGSFQIAFIDALYNLTQDQLSQTLRITHE